MNDFSGLIAYNSIYGNTNFNNYSRPTFYHVRLLLTKFSMEKIRLR